MSAIAGIYYLDDRVVDLADLERMVDILAHRGADNSDIWSERAVGLGHRLLWTTPESLLEKLPLVNQTGDVLTADARIDNRDELIAALALTDQPAEKITDSQLILSAYEKWGDRCPEYLLGDFAFAIWDQRNQKLFCARDHFGVKPFYYYQSPGQSFVFGSEIKALLCLPEVPRQLNQERVADHLAVMLEDKANTFYQNIFRLPPAHSLTVSRQGLQLRSYWSLDPTRELRLGSDAEYAEAFREIFTEAVCCRLRSAFPIGSHLSGGLDSSSVTCVARQLLAKESNTQLHTFSNIFENIPECDERPFIKTVLEQGGLISHEVHADQIGPLSDMERILWYQDEAFIGPTHFLIWAPNHAAQQAGVRVVLNGFDGDTVVSHGSGYFTELIRKGQWATFAEEAHALSERVGNSPLYVFQTYGSPYLEELAHQWRWLTFAQAVQAISKHFSLSRWKLLLDHGLKPLVPKILRRFWQTLRGRSKFACSEEMINHKFSQQVGLQKRIQKLAPSKSLPFTEREHHWQGINSGLVTSMMEILDRHAAAFSIEARHPFMDKRLIEFCLSLPPEQKLHQGWTRLVMRRAMAGILPEQIQWRPTKSNMSPSFVRGLLNVDRDVLEKAILNDIEGIEAYVNTDILRETYDHVVSSPKIKPDDAVSVWRVAILALWLHYAQPIVE